MNPKHYPYQVFMLLILCTLLYDLNVQATEISKRIVSGSQAALGQFPWQAILKVNESDVLLCGGSIISDIWVLTAAHCTYNLNSVFLVFGTIDLFNYDINMYSRAIFMHPQYNDINANNDIALIQLPEKLIFNRYVQPIALVTSTLAAADFTGAQATIAGFGATGDNDAYKSSRVLLWAHVVIVNNMICLQTFGSDFVKDTNICANPEYDENTSICNGDSGGPLIWQNEANNFIQIGINSFNAVNKCAEHFPMGFAGLGSYLNFIQYTTGLAMQ